MFTLATLTLKLLNNTHLCCLNKFPDWTSSFDDLLTSDCHGCENPCEQEGICSRGSPKFTCECPPDFIGSTCQIDLDRCRSNPCGEDTTCVNGINGFSCEQTSSDCSLGYEKTEGPESSCSPCPEGSFGVLEAGSAKCVPCQKGTSSGELAATSSKVCEPCAKGYYSASIHATSCVSCHGGCSDSVASFSASGFSAPVIASDFYLTVIGEDGKVVLAVSKDITVGYYYLGICLGLVLISGVIAVAYRRKFRKLVSPVAVILKTPFSYMQVILPSGIVTEIPSFYRGLVGIWVILGLVFVTAYQIHIFATQRITDISALQPGTAFLDGTPTSKTSSSVKVSVVVHQTPITCDLNYIFTGVVTDVLSKGMVNLPVACSPSGEDSSVTLTSDYSGQLSFTTSSVMTIRAESVDGSHLFNQGVSYELVMGSIDRRQVVMQETLVPANSSLLGGNVKVDLSLTPTELVTDKETLSHGYSYSQFSSEIASNEYPSSPTFEVAFSFPVSQSLYFQVKKTEAINGLQFVVGLLALASGVITGGSLGANLLSHWHKKWKERRLNGGIGMEAGEGKGLGKKQKPSSTKSKLEVPLLESVGV